ncbi:MAG: hypothetical protein HY644_06700 [Acidobacteria bacterium]|nr:hypothetical protein [Acidobacteriota bacterium]
MRDPKVNEHRTRAGSEHELGPHLKTLFRLGLLALSFCVSLLPVKADAETHVLMIRGSGGEPAYDQLFSKWVSQLSEQLRPIADSIVTLSPDLEIASTRESILAAFTKYEALGGKDIFFLLLIGHGSYDQSRYRFNIPGPDITAGELSAALAKIPAQVVVVNGTSCSGASLPLLSGKNRVVITATRSGRESNPPRFLEFLIDGLDGRADTDKNGSVSLLELFQHARRKTAQWYQSQNRLASEHALLDDTGIGKGNEDPAPGSADGAFAASLIIVRSESHFATTSKELLERKQELEAAIEKLRFQKSTLGEDDYQRQLEALVLELARINKQIAEESPR